MLAITIRFTMSKAFSSRITAPCQAILRILVESMGDIIPRTSQLDPDVLVSPHPAPDVLGLRLCSCGDNRGSFREPLRGYLFSNSGGVTRKLKP